MAAHHERVAAMHGAFLQLQQSVHAEFLTHRARMLDGLARAWSEAPAEPLEPALPEAPHHEDDAADAVEPAVDASAATAFEAPMAAPPPSEAPGVEVARTVTSAEVTWDSWFIDAHVMPAGVLFAPLGRLAALLPRVQGGVFECDVRASIGAPKAGESVSTEVQTGVPTDPDAQELAFRMHCRAGSTGRPVLDVEGYYSRSGEAAPPLAREPLPAADAASWAWTSRTEFTDAQIARLHEGDVYACFGKGFEKTASHTRTAPLPGARLVRLSSVSAFEPTGGPWASGRLRARVAAEPPDTSRCTDAGLAMGRVFQGALQTLAFFAIATGGTAERDGWRFELLAGHAARLRFAAAPGPGTALDYELNVERLEAAPGPVVIGDVKAWAGDQLVFHGERLGLQLIRDYPLSSDRGLQADAAAEEAEGRPAANIEGYRVGFPSLVAGALGSPVDAFSAAGAFFDEGDRRMPRLPGPPYHFITRVTSVAGERLTMRPGAEATFEYDVPPDAWYFDDNGNPTMPFCVLLEAALQPCGWLSVYVGCPLTVTENVFFRNLDGGNMKMFAEVRPDSGTLRTYAKVTSVTRVSGVMLLSYKIECTIGDKTICTLTAMFGYFPKEALATQAGLPMSDEQKKRIAEDTGFKVDVQARPAKYFDGALRLPGPILLMLDRVSGYTPGGGTAGKGWLRGEKDVDPHDWFFKAHFFSDPVQPGSLGHEAMLQLLQFFIIEQDLAKGLDAPFFEPLALDTAISWKFRGQVKPESKLIATEVDIVSVDVEAGGVRVVANGSLWVDGIRCYEAKGISMRVRAGRPVRALPPHTEESVIDPAVDRWVADHKPSCTVPVMPGMSMADRQAAAALAHVTRWYPPSSEAPFACVGKPGPWHVVGVSDFRHHGWLICGAPKRLRTETRIVSARAVHRVDECEVATVLYDATEDPAAPRKVSAGRVRLARRFAAPPPAWAPLSDAVEAASPYTSGGICWGPRLQLLRRWSIGSRGATAELDAAGADAPLGAVHHILLDGALHAIPHERLELWCDKIPAGRIGVPVRLSGSFYGPPPAKGTMRAEIRFLGFDGANAFPTFGIQIIDAAGRVWASVRHVEVLIPSHPRLPIKARMPFLLERRFCEGVGLSEFHADRSELHAADVKLLDGLPGSVALVYGLDASAPVDHRVVAIKDHVGQIARVHPGRVRVAESLAEAWVEDLPGKAFAVAVESRGTTVIVRSA
jgi:3-hydroxymyristoyl/3-hydroxydecanoyl-(acyl carrier protein) dehydratase